MNVRRYYTSLVLAFATDPTTIVSSEVDLDGLLRGILVNAPDLDSTNTYSITIKDADGYTIYTKTGLAKSTRQQLFVDANNHPLQLPISGNHTITIVTSGSQTANRTFPVVLLLET